MGQGRPSFMRFLHSMLFQLKIVFCYGAFLVHGCLLGSRLSSWLKAVLLAQGWRPASGLHFK